MNEIYKDIQGYEGKYQISNLGNVYSLITNKILKPGLTLDGYYQVNLYKNGVKKHLYIHRLVAQSFLDNTNNYPIINHKDENPMNNIYSNLEWCDKKYNNNYGKCKDKHAKTVSKPINQYDLQDNFITQWNSMNEAIVTLKLRRGELCFCRHGSSDMTE